MTFDELIKRVDDLGASVTIQARHFPTIPSTIEIWFVDVADVDDLMHSLAPIGFKPAADTVRLINGRGSLKATAHLAGRCFEVLVMLLDRTHATATQDIAL